MITTKNLSGLRVELGQSWGFCHVLGKIEHNRCNLMLLLGKVSNANIWLWHVLL